jgi:hypothetical protein
MKKPLWQAVLLSFALIACNPPTPPVVEPPPDAAPTIGAVRITTPQADALPTTLAPLGTLELEAVLEGTGDFDPNVTWTADAGTLSEVTGQQTTFTAPKPATAQTITITATSLQDSSQKASLTLEVPASFGSPTSLNLSANLGADKVHRQGELISIKAIIAASGFLETPELQWDIVSGNGLFVPALSNAGKVSIEQAQDFSGAATVGFTAQSVGQTVVKASIGSLSQSITISTTTATQSAVTGIELDASKVAMFVGQSTTISALVKGEGTFNDDVTFLLEAGEGTLEVLPQTPVFGSQSQVRFTATAARTAVVKVSSVQDPSVFERIYLGIDPSKQTIAAGFKHEIAISNTRFLFASGNNFRNQLGVEGGGANIDLLTVPNISDVASVATGNTFSMALTTSGQVKAWGRDTYGAVGDGGLRKDSLPVTDVAKPLDSGTVAIATSNLGFREFATLSSGNNERHNPESDGGATAMAIKGGGGVYCWGVDLGQCSGKLELRTCILATSTCAPMLDKPKLIKLSGIEIDADNPKKEVVGLAVGKNHVVVLTSTGAVFGWGENPVGGGPLGVTTGNNLGKKIKFPLGLPNGTGGLENRYIAVAAFGNTTALLNAKGQIRVLKIGNGSGEIISQDNLNLALTQDGENDEIEVISLKLGNKKIVSTTLGGNNFDQLAQSDTPIVSFGVSPKGIQILRQNGTWHRADQLWLGSGTEQRIFSNGSAILLKVP